MNDSTLTMDQQEEQVDRLMDNADHRSKSELKQALRQQMLQQIL